MADVRIAIPPFRGDFETPARCEAESLLESLIFIVQTRVGSRSTISDKTPEFFLLLPLVKTYNVRFCYHMTLHSFFNISLF